MAAKKKAATGKKTAAATKKKAAASKTTTDAAKATPAKAAKKTTAKTTASKKVSAKKAVAKKKVSAKVATKKSSAESKTETKKVAAATQQAATTKPKPRNPPKPSKKQTVQSASSTPENTDEYMNSEQSEHFRTKLLEWKHQLMEEVDRTVDHMKDDATNFPDPNDRATQEEEFSLELRTRDRERKLIKKIDESLRAIDSGDYGYCESCGIEIGTARLEARPTATLCIDCKTMEEIRERQSA